MKISVTVKAGLLVLEVEPTETVKSVKEMIKATPEGWQSLKFNNKDLPDDFTLQECGIVEGSELSFFEMKCLTY